jgi:hypothetical protein
MILLVSTERWLWIIAHASFYESFIAAGYF